ncbi:hypothetical protein T265_01361 [Opisthorchis viverrini]|uniref:Uncharacterized protein n=1 Tax=Opisthorchis viverrini TaxID=6198 RepID=A0A075A380_OPIVI|nr:hypothetical protein T265_01361 [Opisthorchis viverrini]KER32682.1 hypothetical protein T265_01361 [Opisthorchis viverrini]
MDRYAQTERRKSGTRFHLDQEVLTAFYILFFITEITSISKISSINPAACSLIYRDSRIHGISRIDTQDRGFRPSFSGRFCSCRSVAVVHLKGTGEKRA